MNSEEKLEKIKNLYTENLEDEYDFYEYKYKKLLFDLSDILEDFTE